MDRGEHEARQKFFRETGKTPEQEGRDTAQMAGVVFLVAIAVVVGCLIAAARAAMGY